VGVPLTSGETEDVFSGFLIPICIISLTLSMSTIVFMHPALRSGTAWRGIFRIESFSAASASSGQHAIPIAAFISPFGTFSLRIFLTKLPPGTM